MVGKQLHIYAKRKVADQPRHEKTCVCDFRPGLTNFQFALQPQTMARDLKLRINEVAKLICAFVCICEKNVFMKGLNHNSTIV